MPEFSSGGVQAVISKKKFLEKFRNLGRKVDPWTNCKMNLSRNHGKTPEEEPRKIPGKIPERFFLNS